MKNCTLKFLQDILYGYKRHFKRTATKQLRIPMWNELSIDKMWELAVRIRDFLNFMPEDWTTSRKVERTFFWIILVTLAPEYVEQLINNCRAIRHENQVIRDSRVQQDEQLTR